MKRILLALFIILSMISCAWADDAVEAPVIGNIVFEKAPELLMQDETLTISKSAGKKLGEESYTIDVDFHIKNTSSHDVTRKIAFVLPPIQCRMDANSTWQGVDSTDAYDMQKHILKDFTTTINGTFQAYTTRTEAMLNQKNITDLLSKLNIPLNPCKILTVDGNVDPKYKNDLVKHHLLTESNEAAWSENVYFEWTQNFPAGQVINIHHHYTPTTGGAVLNPRTVQEINDEFTRHVPPLKPIWNHNPESLSQSNPAIMVTDSTLDVGKKQTRFCVMPIWIQYHLTTGAIWNKGIGIFKLIISDDSNAPFAVNQFYKNENAKVVINGNSVTFTIENFIPTQNLLVQFLSLPQSAEDFQACGIKQ